MRWREIRGGSDVRQTSCAGCAAPADHDCCLCNSSSPRNPCASLSLPPCRCHTACPAADPQNQKNMTRTRQPDRSPYSDGFHTMAVDWEAGKITSEWCPAGLPCWLLPICCAYTARPGPAAGGEFWEWQRLAALPHASPAFPPSCLLPASRPPPAVSVDGEVSKVYLPREEDPQFGWWTSAANAPPNAPFASDPFYIIL
jgi:hypothetical protein